MKESMGSVENRTFFGNTTSPSRADSDPISPPDPSPSSMKRPPLPPVPLLPLAMQAYSFGYNKRGSSSIIVSFIHRALDRTDTYFLNPFRCGNRVYVWLSYYHRINLLLFSVQSNLQIYLFGTPLR